ncbi:MAG: cation diffusion facilitator family transporter [Cyanobacteria bacterium J06598_3]
MHTHNHSEYGHFGHCQEGHSHTGHSHTGHSHAHAGHAHCAVPTTPEQLRSLRIALVLVTCFSIAEFWVSVQSHSLSLMADAGHMTCDVFAIALSLWAASLAAKPEGVDPERLNAMAALVNGGLLVLVASWLGWESFETLRAPAADILSTPVAITAAVGLGVNGLNAYLLHAHADENLNLRGAFLHMLADAGSCLGVLIGAVLIARYGWYWADGVVGGAIALLISFGAVPLMRQSWATLQAVSSDPLVEDLMTEDLMTENLMTENLTAQDLLAKE